MRALARTVHPLSSVVGHHPYDLKKFTTRSLPLTSRQEDRLGLDYTVLTSVLWPIFFSVWPHDLGRNIQGEACMCGTYFINRSKKSNKKSGRAPPLGRSPGGRVCGGNGQFFSVSCSPPLTRHVLQYSLGCWNISTIKPYGG